MILIDVIDLKTWQPLRNSKKAKEFYEGMSDEFIAQVHREFAVYLTYLLKSLVQNAVARQQFRQLYRPLSPKYRQFKAATGLMPGHWRATDTLIKSITIWQDKGNPTYHIGFPESLMYPGTDKSLAMVAKANEEGVPAKHLPARPLFIPFAEAISKHIYDHFVRFINHKYPRLSIYL